ncbi:hypothetical protein BKA65DRAFT_585291 [Rhexocercosporidium sp. MPI-PUGE-AT-0058]|nr:hypothetical protein BKA65DRAFT_585291 [Rhexocercosporidium sp. MPI-PUGE-AT-0058]
MFFYWQSPMKTLLSLVVSPAKRKASLEPSSPRKRLSPEPQQYTDPSLCISSTEAETGSAGGDGDGQSTSPTYLHTCDACKKSFSSRNKLFKHIREVAWPEHEYENRVESPPGLESHSESEMLNDRESSDSNCWETELSGTRCHEWSGLMAEGGEMSSAFAMLEFEPGLYEGDIWESSFPLAP